jgi:hypothetical protein
MPDIYTIRGEIKKCDNEKCDETALVQALVTRNCSPSEARRSIALAKRSGLIVKDNSDDKLRLATPVEIKGLISKRIIGIPNERTEQKRGKFRDKRKKTHSKKLVPA